MSVVRDVLVLSGKSGPKDQVALYYYYTSPLHWCTRYRNCKFHNRCPSVAHCCVSWALVVKCKMDFFLIPEINEVSRHARTISWHADGISWYSIPASAGPLLTLLVLMSDVLIVLTTVGYSNFLKVNHTLVC